MKVLVVCQHFYPEQFRINDICKELVKNGHEVTVLTGLPNYPKGKVLKEYKWFRKRRETVDGVKVVRCSLIGRGKSSFRLMINYIWFALFASFKALFMKKDFDVVYVYQLSPITMAIPAIVVKEIKNIPLIIHCLDQWPISITTVGVSKKGILYKFLEKLSKVIYNEADIITISSKSFKKYFKNDLHLDDKKQFIYCPSYAESDYENLKDINDDTFDLVFAGNIGPALSVETIVKAANLLKDDKKVKFHIVGDGLSRSACEALANEYGLDNIKFYGFFPVKEMGKFYSLADAFLITMADNEVVNNTLPAKVQSYMIAAKPIIGAINGEVYDVVKEANCGMCCKSLDYKGLAQIIKKVKEDKKKLSLWSKNAYQYYKKNFDKDDNMNKLEGIMEEAISNHKDYKQTGFMKFFKYALSGGLCMIIDLLLFTVFFALLKSRLSYSVIMATICARIISSLINYFINRNFVFREKGISNIVKYYTLCICQMMLSGIIVQLLYSVSNLYATLIKLVVDIIIFIVNYEVQKRWVFRRRKKL